MRKEPGYPPVYLFPLAFLAAAAIVGVSDYFECNPEKKPKPPRCESYTPTVEVRIGPVAVPVKVGTRCKQ